MTKNLSNKPRLLMDLHNKTEKTRRRRPGDTPPDLRMLTSEPSVSNRLLRKLHGLEIFSLTDLYDRLAELRLKKVFGNTTIYSLKKLLSKRGFNFQKLTVHS